MATRKKKATTGHMFVAQDDEMRTVCVAIPITSTDQKLLVREIAHLSAVNQAIPKLNVFLNLLGTYEIDLDGEATWDNGGVHLPIRPSSTPGQNPFPSRREFARLVDGTEAMAALRNLERQPKASVDGDQVTKLKVAVASSPASHEAMEGALKILSKGESLNAPLPHGDGKDRPLVLPNRENLHAPKPVAASREYFERVMISLPEVRWAVLADGTYLKLPPDFDMGCLAPGVDVKFHAVQRETMRIQCFHPLGAVEVIQPNLPAHDPEEALRTQTTPKMRRSSRPK